MAVNYNSTSESNFCCGATLVATNWAITAAHCVLEVPCLGFINAYKNNTSVVLGEFDLSSSTDGNDGKRLVLLKEMACSMSIFPYLTDLLTFTS